MNIVRFQYPLYGDDFTPIPNRFGWINIGMKDVPRVGEYVALPKECPTAEELEIHTIMWNLADDLYDMLVILK